MDKTDIDISTVTAAYDHDRNVHTGDIGQDHLLDVLPYDDADEFVDTVYDMRDGAIDPSDLYPEDEGYSPGEELGIMLAEQEVDQRAVLGQVEASGFRDGFQQFLQDSLDDGSPTYIISAGDEDFLRAVYDEAGIDDELLTICGTRQSWGQDSKSNGIMYGNGRAKKGKRLETEMYLQEQLHDIESGLPLIASGDSDGDANLLRTAREQDGLAIATGPDAADHADIVVEGYGWYGQMAATLAVAGQETGLDHDEIVEETQTYMEQFEVPEPPTVRAGPHAGEDRGGIRERGHQVKEIIDDVFQ